MATHGGRPCDASMNIDCLNIDVKGIVRSTQDGCEGGCGGAVGTFYENRSFKRK